MINISQAEAKYLRNNGRAHDIHMSSQNKKGRGKKYYLTESYKSLKLLNDYRNKRIIETHEVENKKKK